MGRKKFIDKKHAVMFKLVPSIDDNGVERVMLQHVETRNCKLTPAEKRELIAGLSNEHEFTKAQKEQSVASFNNKPVYDSRFDGIPPEILQKIRGRSDLVINNKPVRWQTQEQNGIDDDEDYEDDIRIEQVDEVEGEQWQQGHIEEWQQEEFIDDEEGDVEEIEVDAAEEKEQVQETKKPAIFLDEDFPAISNIDYSEDPELLQQAEKLTDEQYRLLNQVLPEDYKHFQVKGLKLKKYDMNGFPLDDGYDYNQHIGKSGVKVLLTVASSEIKPSDEVDTDIRPEELPNEAFEVEQCLNQALGYEPLEDDFFANLVKSEKIEIVQQKPIEKKAVKENKKEEKPQPIKSVPVAKPQVKQAPKQEKPAAKPEKVTKAAEVNKPFSKKNKPKYQDEQEQVKQTKKSDNEEDGEQWQDDEEDAGSDSQNEEIDEAALDKAVKDFDNNKEPEEKKKYMPGTKLTFRELQKMILTKRGLPIPPSEDEESQEEFEEEEEDEREFHELNKKERLKFMREFKVQEFEQIQEEERKIKMKTFKNVDPNEIHLRTVYPKLKLEEDIAMQQALQDSGDSDFQEEIEEVEEDDIVSNHIKNSTICSNLNYVDDGTSKPSKKKNKKSENDTSQMNESTMRETPKTAFEKRNKHETAEERKQRKQMIKDFKKDRREAKKEFIEELNKQKKVVVGNTNAPMYGISRIKIH